MPNPIRPFSSYSSEELFAAAKLAYQSADLPQLQSISYEYKEFRHSRMARSHTDTVVSWLGELKGSTTSAQSSSKEGVEQKSSRRTNSRGREQRRSPSVGLPPPTPEQTEAVSAFLTGKSLKINAFAGTGKTSTLEYIAHSSGKTGLYLAFNKSIVRDSKDKFPDHVTCLTVHGLAYRAMAPRYRGSPSKLVGKINPHRIVELFALQDWNIHKQHTISAIAQGHAIIATVKKFAQSEDETLGPSHVPTPRSLFTAPKEVVKAATDWLANAAKALWAQMIDADSLVPLGHEGYLKLWALSNPRIAADYILLDEAQDTNNVVLGVLKRQSAQLVLVGDKYQQIYEFLGAINAMDKIETVHTTYLTQSFRFGDVIAAIATKVLRLLGEQTPLRGNPAKVSRIGPIDNPDAILARTNASTLSAIIDSLEKQNQPHLVGGTDDLKRLLKGVIKLKNNEPCDAPELFGFQNWQEVVAFAKSDEGAELLMFVNLVEIHGEMRLLWAINRCVEEAKSDITISTAHKAKGRQWKTVRLSDDFLKSSSANPMATNLTEKDTKKLSAIDPAELRLLYVALTRAKDELEIPESILQFLGVKGPQ